ncbi:sensor histidine kinase [Oceanirhabdus sp. W0125-5]|uniref:sensor histidine kinase n=1 Tax=Oceanirhabdus sp. W0125-5 TaxID=2999116 RepID=UPI0022F2ED1D|nr:HAMP domain-containing sensor histidine kinase [Oceanirhabdus sp. W0125-5]WBW98176.1 HAMP domain-containing sensor histidine kinase [Oceanirhabdus sp. W0125-5]
MHKNGSVKKTLFANYIVFTITSLCLLIVCLLGGAFLYATSLQRGSRDFIRVYNVMAEDIVRRDYKNINTDDLEKLNGWIEIVDEEGSVVYSNGVVQKVTMNYGPGEIYDLLVDEHEKYFISSTKFEGYNGVKYRLIVRADKNLYHEQFTEDFLYDFIASLKSSLMVFLILFFLNIYLFSIWVGKRITNPLTILTERLRNFARSEKKKKIHFDNSVEIEFVEIADSFNYMIDEIERIEEEKKELEDSKQKLIVDISHDIKTPITTIQGYAKAITDGMVKDEEDQKRYLNTIYMKAKSVTELINLLFDYVKLDHRSYELNFEKKDINELVRQVIAEYYEEIVVNGFEIQVNIKDEKLLIDVDFMQMKRVISNLVSNSLKYNSPGTKIIISIEEEDDSVIVRVGDTGVGIPKDIKGTIFEPFVRGKKDKASKVGGSGLGLSIVKKIVEMHRGTIELYDEVGEMNSLFEIKLPKER